MSQPTPIQQIETFLGQFKTPAGAVAALGAVVGVLGEFGVLNTDWTGGLKALLSAVAFLVVLATGGKAAQMGARRAATAARARQSGLTVD